MHTPRASLADPGRSQAKGLPSFPEPEALPPEASSPGRRSGQAGVDEGAGGGAGVVGRNARSATALVPVIGPRNLAQLEDYLAALDVHLDDEQYRRLNEASRIQLGQPHDLISSRRGPLLGGDAGAFESPVVPVA
jgi:hypothetical protein